ncbi:hypothetical protein ACKWTF_002439 [Chironomus riparius]
MPNKNWLRGVVINKCQQPRSYEIRLENNSVIRRNSKFIRLDKSTVSNMNNNDEVRSEVQQYRVNLDNFFMDNSLHNPTRNSNTTTNTITSSTDVQQQSTSDENKRNQQPPRRSSRIPKPVQRFGNS